MGLFGGMAVKLCKLHCLKLLVIFVKIFVVIKKLGGPILKVDLNTTSPQDSFNYV